MPLTRRWTPLKHHDLQSEYYHSKKRFNVVPAGRRSGKSELAKRRVVKRALSFTGAIDGLFICAAPTFRQAREIFWNDMKALTPKRFVTNVNESRMAIKLVNGSEIVCVGLDKPERVEGRPIDGGVLDEYGNMKPDVWTHHLRPALDTLGRPGWMDFTGVPEGRNHYYDLWKAALADDTWGAFTWKSSDILPPDVIATAKRELDPLTYQQEYEASFVTFEGRAYYTFAEHKHCMANIPYDPKAPIILGFDFNRQPGVCAIMQEKPWMEGVHDSVSKEGFTGIIGEVFIPYGSNTVFVCQKILEDWGEHEGDVLVHGDATGGNKTSSNAVSGSDWDLVSQILKPHFQSRMKERYPKSNPPERSRLNAVNSRLESSEGTIRMLVDHVRCSNVVKDFEGVRLVKGGSGQLDKNADLSLSHISDGIGYYIVDVFPVRQKHVTRIESIF